VAEKERLRDGERKEFGEREERFCWLGEGYEFMGGRRLSLFRELWCSCVCVLWDVDA
jgi:hypothetical protein